MKFKPSEKEPEANKMSNKLYDGFIDLLQFEQDKLGLICSAKFYFYDMGLIPYKKFFKALYKKCEETRNCLITYLRDNLEDVPQLKIPAIINNFDNPTKPFEMLAEMEDQFESKLNALITIANEDKNWRTFSYLLDKLSKIDHICCRAFAAVQNKVDPNGLLPCEQHS